MDQHMAWEIVGYCGSALVLVSLLMSSVVKLRVINAIGSLIFCVYAFHIRSIPTAIMNVALVVINLFFLYRTLITKRSFRIAETGPEDSTVTTVLAGYQQDVEQYFGKVDLHDANLIYAIYEEDTVVGVTAGIASENEIRLFLDYSTPKYRDCSVGRYVLEHLLQKYTVVTYTGSNEKHIAYLQKLGYEQRNGRYEKHRSSKV